MLLSISSARRVVLFHADQDEILREWKLAGHRLPPTSENQGQAGPTINRLFINQPVNYVRGL
jgi:hypothetical protein